MEYFLWNSYDFAALLNLLRTHFFIEQHLKELLIDYALVRAPKVMYLLYFGTLLCVGLIENIQTRKPVTQSVSGWG